jgi:hypothetical protein
VYCDHARQDRGRNGGEAGASPRGMTRSRDIVLGVVAESTAALISYCHNVISINIHNQQVELVLCKPTL